MNLNKTTWIASVSVLEIIGNGLQILMINEITNKGIYADEHHLSGAMSTTELGLLVGSILVLCMAVLIFWIKVAHAATKDKPSAAEEALQSLTVWILICNAGSILVLPLVGIAILGPMAIRQSYREGNRGTPGIFAYRLLNMIVVLAVLAGVTLSFLHT